MRAESIERNNFAGIPFKNSGTRHSTDHTGIFTLRDGHSARGLDRTKTRCAIIPHAVHKYPDGSKPKLLGHGMEKHVRGWTMSIDRRPIGKPHHIPPGHAANHHVAISRTNQNAAGEKKIAGPRFVNFKSAAFVEAFREHFGEPFRHVLHDHNRGLKIRRNLRQSRLQCVWTAGRNSDGDDAARRQRSVACFFRRGGFFNHGGRKLAASGSPGDFNFCNQLIGNLFEMSGGRVLGLGHKIDGAKREGFEGSVAAFFRMSAEKNDRQGSAPHDETQRIHAVHTGHLQVEGHDIGLQLFNFFQCETAVHGGADNFDGRVAREDGGDEFPHESGIIDDGNTDTFAHAIAPSGVAREKPPRVPRTLSLRTTVPSPRMEAPLTRSLETISPGRALITSSSSPTMLSTSRPKRFSAAPMTMTKCFFRTGWVSTLRKRLR